MTNEVFTDGFDSLIQKYKIDSVKIQNFDFVIFYKKLICIDVITCKEKLIIFKSQT